jgi:catalase
MKFLSLALAVSPALVAADLKYAAGFERETTASSSAESYSTDLFKGTNLKQEESSLNNSDLTYTQRNGKQYFQPLGAQRAGENGPLLLQDVHLIDTLATFNRERIPER